MSLAVGAIANLERLVLVKQVKQQATKNKQQPLAKIKLCGGTRGSRAKIVDYPHGKTNQIRKKDNRKKKKTVQSNVNDVCYYSKQIKL